MVYINSSIFYTYIPHKTSYCISACRTYRTAYKRLHEDEPSRFETFTDTTEIKYYILISKIVQFVGLRCVIISQCTVQKTYHFVM